MNSRFHINHGNGVIQFFCTGDPRPKGSSRAFHYGKRIVVTNDCKTAKPWEEHLTWTAREYAPATLITGGVEVVLDFVMRRTSHLPKTKTPLHLKRCDVDKLARLALDALTGVMFVDDSQVVALHACKRYAQPGEASGVFVTLVQIEGAAA